MKPVERILIVQSAFLGDVVLTLPLAQVVKDFFGSAKVDMLVVPHSAELIRSHPALHEVIEFDKYGADKGLGGLLQLAKRLRQNNYGLAIVPHRSFRSALVVLLAGIPLRIGFDRSAGRYLFNKTVKYREDAHEVERNIFLLSAIGIQHEARELPKLYPAQDDVSRIDTLMTELRIQKKNRLIAIAPGTVWNTKRWLKERFAALAAMLAEDRFDVMLIGGKDDKSLCEEIQQLSKSKRVYSTAGMLSTLQSAELIRRCKLLVCNDSAPLHFAVAVDTPVVAVFGATVPEFGFAPYGKHDAVVETRGLQCRPCAKHGGDQCPIKTFDCMVNITEERVYRKVEEVLEKSGV